MVCRGSILLELFQFIHEILVFRNAFLNKPDDAALVDQVGHPSTTVQFLDRFVFIGNERKRDTVLVCEFSVCLHAVGASADNLCIQLFKLFQITLEFNEFIRSDL